MYLSIRSNCECGILHCHKRVTQLPYSESLVTGNLVQTREEPLAVERWGLFAFLSRFMELGERRQNTKDGEVGYSHIP